MNLRQNELKRTIHAPAKLNLFLEVLGRRDDGFHELETLMVPIRLFDSLTLAATPAVAGRSGEILFRVAGVGVNRQIGTAPDQIPTGAENLVVRALELLRERSGCQMGAEVELIKRIPSAAGLGGGSSDAAAALRLASRAWSIDWQTERLAKLAAELGSDVPFFLSHGAAICRGRGEVVERLPGTISLHGVVVKPPAVLATRDVYAQLGRVSPEESNRRAVRSRVCLGKLSRLLRQGNLVDLGEWMGNRLQAAAGALAPWIDRVQGAFAALDFLGHQLSGSGSAYFGICRHASHAERLATILRTRRLGLVFVTSSCR
jgi:4-diphosphocytidyl-2-C-methyl-D-erythritol kinase